MEAVLSSRTAFAPCRLPSRKCEGRKVCASRRQPARPQALFGGGKDGGGGNPFANMSNLMENVKKAQQVVQQEAARVQEELARAEFDGYSEDETVKVVMSGNQEPKSVDLTEEALAGGPEAVSERVTQAMRDAHGKSVEGMKTRMKEMASGLGLGGLGGGNGMLGM